MTACTVCTMHLKKVDESVVVVISLSIIIDLSSWQARARPESFTAGRRTEDMNAKLSFVCCYQNGIY